MEADDSYISSDPSDRQSGTGDLKSILTKERGISLLQKLEDLQREFSPSERLVLYTFTILLALSTLSLVAIISDHFSSTAPTHGGSLVEGEVGPARFINPILTLSQPDQDLTSLIFSGLMRALPDGSVVPDLASTYAISSDGTTYTFTLRENAVFHDGTPVTSADVLFTVQAAQNPDMKSPHRADWDGVQASAPDAHTVIFKLSKAYAPFIYNTTLGILPKHLWQNISAENFPFTPLNTHPIGSGPYKVARFDTDSTGAATSYDLVPFTHFTLGTPYIDDIVFLFFPNESELIKAFNAGTISSMAGIAPADLHLLKRRDTDTLSVALPRTFGVFFNQNRAPVLADASVRAALDTAIGKHELVNTVLGRYGVALDGPIPPGVVQDATSLAADGDASSSERIAAAQAILSRGGWQMSASSATSSTADTSGLWKKKKQALAFTLATADEPELVATARAIALQWQAVGVDVKVQVFPISELNTNVIRPRAYDAILFGEVIGREGDFFAFWHSSQRNDPGLNLAMYANAKTDTLLASARGTTNRFERGNLYAQFASLVEKDTGAVFLYAPKFIYIVPKSVQGIELGALTVPGERFLNVYEWYIDTQRVWNIFTNPK